MDREPVLIFLAGLAAVVDAGLIAAANLGWLSWDGDQIAKVVVFVTSMCALFAAMIRAKVTPTP